MGVASSSSVLAVLTQARLIELARGLGVNVPTSGRKDTQIARLLEAAPLPLPALLGHLYRDELRTACREHGLTSDSRSRADLAGHDFLYELQPRVAQCRAQLAALRQLRSPIAALDETSVHFVKVRNAVAHGTDQVAKEEGLTRLQVDAIRRLLVLEQPGILEGLAAIHVA